jgi:tRNA dimethylallyltransferase
MHTDHRGGSVNPDTFADVLILTGPTGSGKSALSLCLAERLDAEIVSMDSMALYRGFDILAAKPGHEDQQRVRHHLLDAFDPWESSSVSLWLEQAARCCHDIRARGKRILFVGGTPLYLKALLHGLFEGPGADATLRQQLEQESEQLGSPVLHARLAAVDPQTAARLHPNDARRIIRALEVWQLTGRPLSAWQTQWDTSATGKEKGYPRCIWLDRPREQLYARIDARVHDMIAQGLVEEVAALRRLPHPVSREAAQAAGFLEVSAHLDGGIDLDETIRRIQKRSRQLAKRQLTWFRSLTECRPADERLTEELWQPTMVQRENREEFVR